MEAHRYTRYRLEKRKNQIKAMFDKFRQSLKIKVGDYVDVYYPKTHRRAKLHSMTFGPFPVTHLSYMPGINNVVGVTVDTGILEEPCPKRYARARVHPFSYV